MKSMAWQVTPTPVLVLLSSLLTTKTNRPLERLSENDGLLVIGAEYSLESGRVEFFDDLADAGSALSTA